MSDEMAELIDWKNMYQSTVKELKAWDILFDAKLHRVRYAASLHGEEFLEWFDSNVYEESLSPNVTDFYENNVNENANHKNIKINGKYLETEPESINDVYKASLFLEKALNKSEY